jgi:hypothetical protein
VTLHSGLYPPVMVSQLDVHLAVRPWMPLCSRLLTLGNGVSKVVFIG